ncbi:endo-N-neuraminidase [Klebsiella pneumoniae]
MYHLDNTSGVPEMPEPKDTQSISPRWFGESQEQGGISWPGADWFNIIQAELINLVVEAGLSPDKSSFDQIASAVRGIGGDGLRRELDSVGGGVMLRLKHGETAQDAIKFVTPLTKPGVENSEYNYQILQEAASTNLHLDLRLGDIYISRPVQLRKGQIVRGQGAPNFSPNCYTRVICLSEGGGCFWYTEDVSTGQVRMPQISHMGLVGDYPVRFNDERTAIIKDDVSLSNVPFGMAPVVKVCSINPRVNGVGIGISWSKMFNGIITLTEIANFETDLLLNGCDLNTVTLNRIRNGWRYMILELSASTFGSQNEIHHNDILHAGSPNCIMVKTTARHARIYDNYLEQATGKDREALIGFIDATDVDAPSYAGNVSAGRYSTILRDNRIDGFSKAKNFVYKYQPKGQTYGEIVDVSTVGSNVGLGSNALTLVDETGATVDSVPLLYNQQQPCSFVFKGPRFGKWNGYTSEGQFSDVINGLNVGAFGTSLYGNLLSDYLRARGNEMVLMAGFASTGIFSYAASSGLFEPEKSYIIEVEAYCASGTEDFTFGGIVSGTGKVSTTFTLSTTPRKMRVEFVTGIAGSSNGIYFSRSNNGADIVIKRVRFLKKYLHENAMSASATKTLKITTQSGEIQIAANGGFQFPAYKILRFINGYLVETFSQINNAAEIDIAWTYSSGLLTVNVTGKGGSKQLAVSQTSRPG